MAALKRIKKELEELEKGLIENCSGGPVNRFRSSPCFTLFQQWQHHRSCTVRGM